MREDIQKSIKEYEIATTPFFKKDVADAEKFLNDDENVILCLDTNFCIIYPDPTKKVALPGVVFLTDKRIVIHCKLKEDFVDTLSVKEINDVKIINVPMGNEHIQVYSEDKVYDFLILTKQRGFVVSVAQRKKDAVNKIYRAFLFAQNPNGFGKPKSAEPPQNAEQPKIAEQSTQDIPEQIEKLSALKEKGIISEEEFQAKKSELLARL